MATSWKGVTEADIVETRFAFAGKITAVNKKPGDRVTQWEWLAVLDKKILQAELDRQLADYERVRADFEQFKTKFPNDTDDLTKYARAEKQAALNAAVKDVEIAKYHIDEAALVAPVAGIVSDMEGVTPGTYVTPASAPVTIIDPSTLRFVFELDQADLEDFKKPTDVHVTLEGIKKIFDGTTTPPFAGKNGKFPIYVTLKEAGDLLPGMIGEVKKK